MEARIFTSRLVSGTDQRIPIVGFRLVKGERIADYSKNNDATT